MLLEVNNSNNSKCKRHLQLKTAKTWCIAATLPRWGPPMINKEIMDTVSLFPWAISNLDQKHHLNNNNNSNSHPACSIISLQEQHPMIQHLMEEILEWLTMIYRGKKKKWNNLASIILCQSIKANNMVEIVMVGNQLTWSITVILRLSQLSKNTWLKREIKVHFHSMIAITVLQ